MRLRGVKPRGERTLDSLDVFEERGCGPADWMIGWDFREGDPRFTEPMTLDEMLDKEDEKGSDGTD